MRRFTRLTGALLALLLVFSVLSGCGGAAPDVPSCTAAPLRTPSPRQTPRRIPKRTPSLRASRTSPPRLRSTRAGSIPRRRMWRSIFISTLICRRTSSPRKMPARSAGTAAGWTITPTANASAATGSETTKDFCRTRPGGSTMSAISTHCTPPRAGRSASYTPMTGLSIIPRITTRALYCFMAKNDVLLIGSFYILSISFPLLCAIIRFGF